MHVLFVHNEYAAVSGEEHASRALAQLLSGHGHEIGWYTRSSQEIAGSLLGNAKAFLTGIYNPCTPAAVLRRLEEFQPDLVQVQNLYPLISPSVFKALRAYGKPVVMRCPNYRLFCPNGLHLCGSEVCERCLTPGREFHCLWRNCLGSYAKSLGYALRGWVARKRRWILDNVDVFLVQSEFQRQKFVVNGIPAEKLAVVPGLLPAVKDEPWELGEWVSFVGRISPEKGIEEFLDAARLLPEVPFAVAGEGPDMEQLQSRSSANVTWHGFLRGEELDRFFQRSRIIVIPSRCYEGFPNVATRAMALGKPVIASCIGVLPEVIEHESTGLLFRVGDGADLAEVARGLYGDPELGRRYGEAGKRKALANYTQEAIYGHLMAAYGVAISARSAAPTAGG